MDCSLSADTKAIEIAKREILETSHTQQYLGP